MKNIIVTGGLGHIGSKLVRTLLENQYKVTCFDNLSTQRISSLRGLVTNKNFTFNIDCPSASITFSDWVICFLKIVKLVSC